MNTLGKILVVLNFVFALVVGAFLTVKFATETNWKVGVDQLRSELDIARKANQALIDTTTGLAGQLSTTKSDLEAKKQDIALYQAQWAVREAELQKAFKDAEARGKIDEVNLNNAITAMERMKKEVEALKASIEVREDLLVKLNARYKDSQDLAMSLDRDLKFSQDRNQGLLGRVQELERHNSEIISGVKSDATGALAKDPTAPNPPQKFMKGIVERVDSKDSSLVSVSLGSDHGLKNGNTLEVYRRLPTPEYIGIVRIEDTHHHNSVGRLVRAPGAPMRAIREGDEVSSSLMPR